MKTLFNKQLMWKQTTFSLCCVLFSLCIITESNAQASLEIGPNPNGVMTVNIAGSFVGTNTAMGREAGQNLNEDTRGNSIYGADAGIFLNAGSTNTLIGSNAGEAITSGSANTYLGFQAGAINTGSQNTFLGTQAGSESTGDNNVFIGLRAGREEQGSNQLYISNSPRVDALVRGDFELETVTINGDLNVADILQLRATNADPGCTTNNDLGKLWMTGINNGTVLRVCRGAANGWQDLF